MDVFKERSMGVFRLSPRADGKVDMDPVGRDALLEPSFGIMKPPQQPLVELGFAGQEYVATHPHRPFRSDHEMAETDRGCNIYLEVVPLAENLVEVWTWNGVE